MKAYVGRGTAIHDDSKWISLDFGTVKICSTVTALWNIHVQQKVQKFQSSKNGTSWGRCKNTFLKHLEGNLMIMTMILISF